MDTEKMNDYREAIKNYLELEKAVIDALDVDAVNDAMNLIRKPMRADIPSIYSGTEAVLPPASHFQNDFQ